MAPLPPLGRQRASLRLTSLLAITAVLLGLMALVGWWFDWPGLRELGLPGPPVRAGTAVWFVLAGLSLILAGRPRGARWARLLARLIMASAGLALVASLAGLPLDLLDLLAPGRASPTAVPTTAVAFGLLGFALSRLVEVPGSEADPIRELALLAAFSDAYYCLLAWLFDLAGTAPPAPTGMAPLGALVLMGLAIAAMLGRPTQGVAALLLSETPGGMLMRRLAPLLLGLPPMLIGFRSLAVRQDWPGLSLATAMLVAILVLGTSWILTWIVGSLNRCLALTESLHEGLVSMDLRGRITSWNPGATRILGYDPRTMYGTPFEQLVLPSRREAFRTLLEPLAHCQSVVTPELELVARDGSPRVVLLSARPVWDGLGRLAGSSALLQDLTRHHQAEQALRASEGKLRAVLEAAPDAIVLLDTAGRFVLVGGKAEAMLGYEREQLLTMRLEDLLPERHKAAHAERRAAFWADPRPQDQEYTLRHHDGHEVPVEINLSPLQLPEGPMQIAVIRDVTSRREAQRAIADRTAELRQIRELGGLKDRLFSLMSHELRTPLSVITGYAELLEEQNPEDPLVIGIQQGASRLTELVNKMLDYGALVSGAMPLYRTELHVPELVADVLGSMRERLRQQGLHVCVAIDPATPCIEADSRRISQILLELLDNAAKFTPPGGKVGITVGPRDQALELVVWDTGIGIPPARLAAIWGGLGQVADTQPLQTGGLGLGLAIVRLLVDLHGGQLLIASEPARGTRVTVRLPRHPSGTSLRISHYAPDAIPADEESHP